MFAKILFFFENLLWSSRYKEYVRKYKIAKNCIFEGIGTMLTGKGYIEIGSKSSVGRYVSVTAAGGTFVRIGKGVTIGSSVKISSTRPIMDQDFSVIEVSQEKLRKRTGDIAIGDYAWIGDGVSVFPNVIVGRNSVVLANSVVVKDVPPNAIVRGNPAKLVRYKW